MALEAWRQLKTKQNKTKTQDKSFLSLLLSKMEFSTYFVYFHTFSYKFKVQRTQSHRVWAACGLSCYLQSMLMRITKNS